MNNKMISNRNATILFEKVYFSSLQDNKNVQICTSFAFLIDKMLSASGEL